MNLKQVVTNHAPDKKTVYTNVVNKARAQNRKAAHFKLKPALAFALALTLIIASLSGYAIAAEAKAYQTAAAFFDTYDLPTEGLSRADIKAIYRDITKKTYSYEKTLELMNTLSIEVYSVELSKANPEELDALWNYRNSVLQNGRVSEGEHYYVDYTRLSETEPYDVYVRKLNGSQELWRYQIPYKDMYVSENSILQCGENTAVFGQIGYTGLNTGNAYVILLDKNGNKLWEHIDPQVTSGYDFAVYSDGELTLFGSRSERTQGRYAVTFTKLNDSGDSLMYKELTDPDFFRVQAAVKVEDYYLLKVWGVTGICEYRTALVSLTGSGELSESLVYTENGKTYEITDMLVYEGRVYLSALLPRSNESEFQNTLTELLNEYYHAWEASGDVYDVQMPEEYNQRLRSLFYEQYDAVLLVCGTDNAVIRAYSVENARSGSLTLSETGEMLWQVLRIDDVKNASVYISSRRVDIAATEFAFKFDKTGVLISKTDLGAYPLFY